MSAQQAVGIDMGGTSVKLGVVEGAKVIHKGDPIITADFDGPVAIVDEMVRRVNALREKFPAVAAVGAGVPGFVNAETGLVHELSNVPGWHEFFLAKVLRQETGLPAIAENDANCMGIAELHFGAGRGMKNFLAITLGTGVGGAVFLDGKLYRGSTSGAGEVGQMSIDWQGVEGPHGNIGALERYVGIAGITARARQLYGAAKTEEECTPACLSAAAAAGDAIAQQVWDEFTGQLASALCNCVWLLNPDGIVIGGGISAAGELVFKPLRAKMDAQLARPFRENLSIVPAKFGNEAGTIGAAVLALEVAGDA